VHLAADLATLSEATICAKFITPTLTQSGWNEAEQVYREYTLRPGRTDLDKDTFGCASGSLRPVAHKASWLRR
jgi:type I site-specific restriction endonuclease